MGATSKRIELMLDLVVKILALSLTPNLESKKSYFLKTEKTQAAYLACNGFRSIPEIMKIAQYRSPTTLEDNLPKWESKGLIISVGSGKGKRYLAIENIPEYLSQLKLEKNKIGGTDD